LEAREEVKRMELNEAVEALREASKKVEEIEQVYIPRSETIERGYATGRYLASLIHYIADMLEK
jgi:hypothetical protein